MLDLTEQDLNEDGLLINLRTAFDRGVLIDEVKINSNTAINLHGSPHVLHGEDDTHYVSPFGVVVVTVVSRQELTQTNILENIND